MTAHDPALSRHSWKRLFGRGGTGREREPMEEALAAPDAVPDDVKVRRRKRTLDDISRFLLAHALPVIPFTLEVAHDIATGSNPALARLVADRVRDREPITLAWLEDALRAAEDENGTARILDLVNHLESALRDFGRTSSAARSATSDYSSALTAHVADLDHLDGSADAIVELAALARGMLDRTRAVERDLARSERETRALQKSLNEARRDAEVDHLTGLPNRRAFEAVLRREYAATAETGEPLCVAFCDIDEFKKINDTHGHEAGDRVLRVVGQALAAISDDKCHVARHGGEEFVALLRGRNLDAAWSVLDTAREALAVRKLVNRSTDRPFGRISFSAGVADAHAYSDAREALRAADEALLKAKAAGRNRVLRAEAALTKSKHPPV